MSEVIYYGAHDLSFWIPNDSNKLPKFAWDDFHLIPKKRPFITYGNTEYRNDLIPKSNIAIYLSPYMPGGKKYSSRSGQWDFYIDHTKWNKWTESKKAIQDYFNGKRLYVSIIDEPDKIYVGRFKVTNYTPGDDYSSVTISYDLDYNPIDDTEKQNLQYRVRFLNIYGRVLQSSIEKYNAVPSFESRNKLKPYEKVSGYDKPITAVKGNADYTISIFNIGDYHSVRFEDKVGGIIYKENPAPSNIIFRVGF